MTTERDSADRGPDGHLVIEFGTLLGLDRGTLGPGDVADLIVLDHDIDHPSAFDAPTLVVKAGTVVYRRPN